MVERPSVPIPTSPGAYLFQDCHGRVLYVGKAKNLRARLANYFGPTKAQDTLVPRIAAMVEQATSIDWIVADTEVGAMMLEYSLIKEHRPRFNIRLRDDKSYPYLAVTLNQRWPRPMVIRGRKRKGVRYFGPYAHAYAIRETLDLLLRTFPLRTCSDRNFGDHERQGRTCLYYQIERCSGPCVGHIEKSDYDQLTFDFVGFLAGDHAPTLQRLNDEMQVASDALEFEQAARLRDQLDAVRSASERQQIVTDRREDLDIIGLHGDELETAVYLFYVRGGRISGQKGFIVENVEDKPAGDLLVDIFLGVYSDADDVPICVEVPELPTEAETLEELLTLRRLELVAAQGDATPAGNPLALTTGDPAIANYRPGRARGGRVTIHVPRWGKKKDLLDAATRNAKESFLRHRQKRMSDHSARSRALAELQEALGLPTAPLRIECFDVSQMQGSEPVASMVVFEDALARKDLYRRFAIRSVDGQDDFAMMREALARRFTAYVQSQDKPEKFAYPPTLLLVDGGRGQLNVALDVLCELSLDGEISAAGLAKRFEEVYLRDVPDPVQLPRGSEALYLLQRIRDEAHRFAVTYHRQRRTKKMVSSALDGVRGLGPVRQKTLIERFGSVEKLSKAGIDEIAAVPGVPRTVAGAVYEHLRNTQ